MTDITKCTGDQCQLKESCYRFIATSNKLWQSMFSKVPYNKKKRQCDFYWKFNKKEK